MILVTGGAGYIGSHIVKDLAQNGYDVLVLDNYSTGHRDTILEVQSLIDSIPGHGSIKIVVGDTGDREGLEEMLGSYPVDAVVHLAAFSQVGESMLEPGRYFVNNSCKTLVLLEALRTHGVKQVVFSSTAAVYGEPQEIPLQEGHPLLPTNPYGTSKLMVEQMLRWFNDIHGMRYVSLRYFNAAGADGSGRIGERHTPETHLIPLLIQTALGQRQEFTIFGDDYDTEDGTCIRDFIHVSDLACAHRLALQALEKGMSSRVYNLGSGRGYSVREAMEAVNRVSGREINYHTGSRRPGDPGILLASSDKIQQELGWKPVYQSLEDIVTSAWHYHKQW